MYTEELNFSSTIFSFQITSMHLDSIFTSLSKH